MSIHDDRDAVYPDQFVVHRVDELDLVDLVADAPGPAGAVETELAEGITISVDFVELGRPLRATIADDAPSDVVARTIGGGRAETLSMHLGTGSERPLRLEGLVDPEVLEQARTRRGSFPPGSSVLARAIGEVAVLESIGEDDRFDPVTRAVALLEAATRRRRELDDVAEQSALIDVAVTAAARLLTGQEDSLRRLVDADEFLALETSKAMAEWAQHPSIRRASDALSSPPERFREVRAAIAGAHLRSAAAEFALDELALPTGEPDVELSDGGLLTLRTPEYRPGTWMRVTEVGPMALLALVPVLDDDGAGIAHAVIGSGYALADLDIEVTDEPVRGSGHRLSAIAHAVALGREAAVRMVNDRRAALRLWESCAQAWEAVDDERRAELARRYAFSGGTGRRPFLAERIDDALNDVA